MNRKLVSQEISTRCLDFHTFGGRDHHLVKSALFTFSVNLCSHTEDKNYGLITKIEHRKKINERKHSAIHISYCQILRQLFGVSLLL